MSDHTDTAPGEHLRPGRGLGHRLRSRRPGLQPAAPRDLGRAARRRLPGRPHRSLRRHVGAGHRRAGPRGRLRHRALHEPRGVSSADRDDRFPGADRWGAADHQRPAVPPAGPAPAAAAVRAEARSSRGSPRSGCCASSCSTISATSRRARPSSTPPPQYAAAHPGQRHRPHARLPGRGRRPVPRVRPQHARGRQPRARGAGRELPTQLDAYLDVPGRGPPRQPARRPHRRTCWRSSSTARSCRHEHVRGTIVLLLIAGIDTTWSAIGSSLWHLAQHPDDRRRLRRRARPDADRDRGVPAGLRARHDGPDGRARTTTSTAAR